jgi:hypothetical protein
MIADARKMFGKKFSLGRDGEGGSYYEIRSKELGKVHTELRRSFQNRRLEFPYETL